MCVGHLWDPALNCSVPVFILLVIFQNDPGLYLKGDVYHENDTVENSDTTKC